MFALRLESELEERLEQLARARNSTKSGLVRTAVIRLLEDEEDLKLAESARRRTRGSKSLARLRKDLGLAR